LLLLFSFVFNSKLFLRITQYLFIKESIKILFKFVLSSSLLQLLLSSLINGLSKTIIILFKGKEYILQFFSSKYERILIFSSYLFLVFKSEKKVESSSSYLKFVSISILVHFISELIEFWFSNKFPST